MIHKRQTLIGGWDQKSVSNRKVAVIAEGASESAATIGCARIGIGSLVVVDYDILQEHNLENQAYTEKHLGMLKVEAIKEIIREIDPKIEVIAYAKRVEELTNEELKADVFLSGLDAIAPRFYVNWKAVQQGVPLIDVGIEGFEGTIRTVIPGKTPCLECHPALMPESKIKHGCSEDPIPSTYITAQIGAAIQVMQLIKIIHGWEVEPYICFNLMTGKSNVVKIKRNPDCPLCGGI
ncbi:MAG: ThiF family adenylyltransferase [Candidatus Nanoarchaeia archaeon]|nr:ThiF family adenylyltransferase [Candidatus Nanoarchaeia archaeon]